MGELQTGRSASLTDVEIDTMKGRAVATTEIGDWVAFSLTKDGKLTIRIDPIKGVFTRATISKDLTLELAQMLKKVLP